jgi:hypothetical protein
MKHSRRAVSLRVVPARPHTRTHAVMRVMIYAKTVFFFFCGRKYFGDLDVYGSIILKWDLEKLEWVRVTGQGVVAALCERCNWVS